MRRVSGLGRIAVAAAMAIVVTAMPVFGGTTTESPNVNPFTPVADLSDIQSRLQVNRPRALPTVLEQTCRTASASNPSADGEASPSPAATYFDKIQPLLAGYLVWTEFPISIYVEPLTAAHESVVSRWQDATAAALQDWGQYIPIAVASRPEAAVIQLNPVMPPLRYAADGTLRAQSGEARYAFYLDNTSSEPILRHRFTVSVKPGQTINQLEASLRHELGHALGLWGHSQLPTDALYHSQVRTPLPVSPRDVATLCEVYRQPTAIGRSLAPAEDSREP